VGKPPTFERATDRIRFPRHARVGAEMAEKICDRLRFSRRSREHVVSLVENHMRFLDVTRMRESTLKRFLRLPDFEDHLRLHRADCLSSNRNLGNWESVVRRREEIGEEDLRPRPLVTGHELMELGYTKGPELGEELRRLEELQLDGNICTKAQALRRAKDDLAT
jgi:tRNA nucleotidyltransferase/poly(A) polymerase